VEEHNESKFTDDPGAKELEKRLGGPSGLPFFAFVDNQGKLIVNSLAPKTGNIGHPAEPHEIDYFLEMVKKAAPRMTSEELATLEKPLRAQKR
jgi:phosphoribosylaminoimidazole carboxylase (NCAIR synthetase)